MSYVDSTQDAILALIVHRLRGVLGLGVSQCYETYEPLNPPKFAAAGVYLSVAPGDGTFDQELFAGGGRHQVAEESSIAVTIYSPIRTDHPDRAAQALHDAARGLLPWKKTVLDTLAGHLLLDGSGNQVLRNPLYPLRSTAPKRLRREKADVCLLAVIFGVDYDWALSATEPAATTTTTTTTTAGP